MPVRLVPTADGRACILPVRAQSGARRRGAAGAWNGMLKFAVGAPALDGRANRELCLALAKAFRLRESAVQLVAGERSREKRFRLEASCQTVAARLAEILG